MEHPHHPIPRGLRRLTAITLATTLSLIALGGAVRATDSGLACPDWPRCFGLWIPPPGFHVWLEHSHRLVAIVVGLQIAALTVWVLARHRRRRDLLWPVVVAAVAVNVQAALGAFVVLRFLQAELVTAHLGMSMLILAALLMMWVAAAHPAPADRLRAVASRRIVGWARVTTGLAFIQILVGGHTTGINAGLVFGREFPLMDGALLPPITSERVAFHVAHRYLAYLLVAATIALVVVAVRQRRAARVAGTWPDGGDRVVRLAWAAAWLTLVQGAIGVANLLTQTSAVTVTLHLAVASWIWALLVACSLWASRLAPPPTDPGHPSAVRPGDAAVPAAAVGRRPGAANSAVGS